MKTNSFDASAITQPGGLYGSINDGLLQALMAYLQFKDRERAGERQIVRDDRAAARQAMLDERDKARAELQARYMEAQIEAMRANAEARATLAASKAATAAEKPDKPVEGRVLNDLNSRAMAAAASMEKPSTAPVLDPQTQQPTGEYTITNPGMYEMAVRNPRFLEAGIDPRTYMPIQSEEQMAETLMAPGVLPDLETEGVNYTRGQPAPTPVSTPSAATPASVPLAAAAPTAAAPSIAALAQRYAADTGGFEKGAGGWASMFPANAQIAPPATRNTLDDAAARQLAERMQAVQARAAAKPAVDAMARLKSGQMTMTEIGAYAAKHGLTMPQAKAALRQLAQDDTLYQDPGPAMDETEGMGAYALLSGGPFGEGYPAAAQVAIDRLMERPENPSALKYIGYGGPVIRPGGDFRPLR